MAVLRNSASAPGRQESLRAHNLALVLRRIAAADQPPSRADVAAESGLTRSTVSALVDDLIRGRLVDEVDPAPRAGAGRPANGLILANHGPAGLGLEINVDYLAATVVDLTGAVRHRVMRHADLRARRPAQVLSSMMRLATAAAMATDREGLQLAGATLGVPGMVEGGLLRLAPNLEWRDVDVRAPLQRAAALRGIALAVENEANLAALGTLYTGADRTFVYVSGEIGVGGGIILDGTLFRGGRGWSGEIGHMTVDPDGPACRCGSRGCLEQYAGQEAILRAAGLVVDGTAATPRDAALDALTSRAVDGDRAALAALDRAASTLGLITAGVVNLLDVDTVVLGGTYTRLAPWLRRGVERELATRVVTTGWSSVTVRPCALGADAASYGAAHSVVSRIINEPAKWLAQVFEAAS